MVGGLARLSTRRLGTIAAALAVVLAVVGIAVVLSRPHHQAPARDTLKTVDSRPSDSATPEPSGTRTPEASQKPSPSESPTPGDSSSPATPAGNGGGTSTSAGSPSMSDLGPVSPGSVVFGYTPGRHSWSGTSNGIDIGVTMSPSAPRAGQTVTFTMHTSASSKCCKTYMVFGNGRETPANDCMEFPSGTSNSIDYTTIYNRSGRYEFLAGAFSRTCEHQGDLYAYVDIASGTSTGQGPDLPVVKVDSSTPAPGHENDPSYVTLWGNGADDDGYIRHLIVDWGDGTSTTFPGDPSQCQPTSDGWPANSQADVPYDPPPVHHYKSYGDFRITLTAISTACDGSDVQRGHASMTWSNPAPAPQPSPSVSSSSAASAT